FGTRMRKCLRHGVDWVARLGGEEFAIVLPETGYKQALETARKLRTSVGGSLFSVHEQSIAVTARFGVCGLDEVSAGERKLPERMFKVADAALYRRKRSGRNQVTAVSLPPTPA